MSSINEYIEGALPYPTRILNLFLAITPGTALRDPSRPLLGDLQSNKRCTFLRGAISSSHYAPSINADVFSHPRLQTSLSSFALLLIHTYVYFPPSSSSGSSSMYPASSFFSDLLRILQLNAEGLFATSV